MEIIEFNAYDIYKRAADIIERAEFACGKGISFKIDVGSTLDCKVTLHGTYSTTAEIIIIEDNGAK